MFGLNMTKDCTVFKCLRSLKMIESAFIMVQATTNGTKFAIEVQSGKEGQTSGTESVSETAPKNETY